MYKKLFNTIELLHEIHGSNNWILPEPITVRLSDAPFHIFEICGLCVSPKMDLFIMDDKAKWHPFDHADMNADKIIEALATRVTSVYKTKATQPA